jgi:endonuclease-3
MKTRSALEKILSTLEKTFGRVGRAKRASAFDMLIAQTCGYPASDDACARGYDALARDVGTSADEILATPKGTLVKAMRAGGIVPEVRAKRLVQIAKAAKDGADFRLRAVLKKMPTIGDPGADKILLFTRKEPIAAVPSNAVQVPVRIGFGKEGASYASTYKSAQAALDHALPQTYDARIRAYQILRRHGQTICKRTRPKCELCPLTRDCDFFNAR